MSLEGNQPWIFIGRTDAEAEALVLCPLMWRANLLEKTLMLGKTEHRRRRGWQRIRWLDDITNSMDMNLSNAWETAKDRETWRAAIHGVTKSRTWLSNWTITGHCAVYTCWVQKWMTLFLDLGNLWDRLLVVVRIGKKWRMPEIRDNESLGFEKYQRMFPVVAFPVPPIPLTNTQAHTVSFSIFWLVCCWTNIIRKRKHFWI